MTDQKAARNDLADARRTIAELREDLDRSQTYMMHKTDEYSASLDRYRDELAIQRETIRRLVVAARAIRQAARAWRDESVEWEFMLDDIRARIANTPKGEAD